MIFNKLEKIVHLVGFTTEIVGTLDSWHLTVDTWQLTLSLHMSPTDLHFKQFVRRLPVFRRVRKNCEMWLLASSCLSGPFVRPHGTTRLPQNGFLRNLIFCGIFRKKLSRKIQVSLQSDKNNGTLHEDRYTFLIISRYLGAIWSFSKASGLPWSDMRHKVPVYSLGASGPWGPEPKYNQSINNHISLRSS